MAKRKKNDKLIQTCPHDLSDMNSALFVGEFSFQIYKTDKKIITPTFPIHRFHYIKKGSVQLFYKDKIVILPKSSIYVIIPNSSIKVLPSRTTETETYYFTFSGYNATKILQALQMTEDNPWHILQSKTIEKYFTDSISCDYDSFMKTNLFLKNCYCIFDYVYKNFKDTNTSTKHSKGDLVIQASLTYIHKNLSNPNLTITDICKNVAFMHPNSFSRLFNKFMNETFPQYLALRRCELAITLMNTGKYNITQVSEMVGYTDPLYFSRIFKKLQTISPSEFMAKVKNKNVIKI